VSAQYSSYVVTHDMGGMFKVNATLSHLDNEKVLKIDRCSASQVPLYNICDTEIIAYIKKRAIDSGN